MADIATFIQGLAGKTPAKKSGPAEVFKTYGDRYAVAAVLGERHGDTKDDTARAAYEKLRQVAMPTINAALSQGSESPADLEQQMNEVEDASFWDDWKAAADAIATALDMATTINAARKKTYQDARSKAIPKISGAMGMAEIGGGAVGAGLAAADALADAGKWQDAVARLDGVAADAEKVNARAPYVRACRRHQDTIKAAFAITANDLGASFRAEWEKALKTAASGAYDAAALEVEALANRVEKAKNDPVLKQQRDAVAKNRAENVKAMGAELGKATVDIGALRSLVAKEIGGEGAKSLAAHANELGDDPGAKAREPIGDEQSAEALFKQSDWFELKDMLHKGEITPDQMWDCWRYRQQFVTKLIDALRKQAPTLIAKTSGSTDLESDIDITFAATEPGDDVKAAKMFNAAVAKKFGKPPGRVFDVNIYPRDYNAINESINPDYAVDPIVDRDIDQPQGAMQKLSRVDQDVATLLKQRRFLDDKTFRALMDTVVAGAPDPATKKQITKQFEEGEDIYLLTALEKVDRIKAKLSPQDLGACPLLANFDQLRDKADPASLQAAQKLLPDVLDQLEAALPAKVMDATDAMYLEKMGDLRKDQSRIAALADPAAEPGQHHEGDCDTVHKGQDHQTWLKGESERLKAKVKKDQFTNIIFANEAYMSQGAIEHVVAGIQAKDPAKKEAIFAKLTPATLMQSCNEQLADFFKDMKSSEHEIAAEPDETKKRRATGEAFVHASKYLVRLLDAAQLLSDKFAKFDPPVPLDFALLKAAKVNSPKELMTKVEAVLLALRKSSTVPADAKGEVGVDEARTVFGVTEIGEFRKLISDFGAELNQQVRRNPEFKAELAVDQETERQFFGVPDMPTDLKDLLASAKALLAAPLADGELEAALGEADGEAMLANELLEQVGAATSLPPHLISQFEDAIIRAEEVLKQLLKADPNTALSRAETLVADGDQTLLELDTYDVTDLHPAHRQDLDNLEHELRDRVEQGKQLAATLQNELTSITRSLGTRLLALKRLMPKAA